MASGYFLGGFAEGAKNAADIEAKQRALDLKSQELKQTANYQNQSLQMRGRELTDTAAYRTRMLDIEATRERNSQARFTLQEADKALSNTFATMSETADKMRAAGKSTQEIAKFLSPLQQSARSIAAKSGIPNASALVDSRSSAIYAGQTATEAAVSSTEAKIAAAKKVSEETGVPMEEALRGQGVVKNDTHTFENIYGKIAKGEKLTPGESKLYQDRLRADTLARLMETFGLGGSTTAPNSSPVGGNTPLPAEAAGQLKEGTETTFGNGQTWTLVNGKPVRLK